MTATEIANFVVGTEKRDDRKNKVYGRSVSFTLFAETEQLTERDMPSDAGTGLPQATVALAAIKPKPKGVDVGGFRDKRRYYLKYEFWANKPSEILSEEEAITTLDISAASSLGEEYSKPEKPGAYLFRLVLKTLQETLVKQDEIVALQKQREFAALIAGKAAKMADTKAREVVRFEQRLAALVAELEAEQKVQLKALVEGDEVDAMVTDHNRETDGPKIGLKAVEVGKRHAAEVLPAAAPGAFNFARPTVESRIKLEELK